MHADPAAQRITEDPRWASVVGRRSSTDFVYSVKTTGVYCRPSCPSRRPAPKNVDFHATPLCAELAGFRPCLRCKPTQHAGAAVAKTVLAICTLLEESDESPSLGQLAAHVGLSESHTHRTFTQTLGLTPKSYREAVLRRRVHTQLDAGDSVTNAIYAAGFNSSGRFYEQVDRLLGMTPKARKARGDALQIRFAVGQCTLGQILVAATARGVCAVLLGDDPEQLVHDLRQRFSNAELAEPDTDFEDLVARVLAIVDARPGVLCAELPLDIRGTAFQQRVWRALQSIPIGTTLSYTELARAIDKPTASRAVARACADNPLAVVIPCHRIVRTGGALSGYRWGVERKLALLRREGAR